MERSFCHRFKKSFWYLTYLVVTQKDSDKIYEYFYDVWVDFFRLIPGEMKHLFLNFGLWLPDDRVAPMQRMHMYIQEKSDIQPTDHILDIGSGLGGQNLLCYETYKPAEIVGLELNQQHVEYCNDAVNKLGWQDRIRYVQGSATEFPDTIPKNYFNKVFALHCVYHFPKRMDFFREAYQRLKADGRLILVDQYLKRLPKDKVEQEIIDFDVRYFKTKEPYYTEQQLLDELKTAGFEFVSSESLIQNIFPPFYDFLAANEKEIRKICSGLHYPRKFVDICYHGAKIMKTAVQQGLYESAILQMRKV